MQTKSRESAIGDTREVTIPNHLHIVGMTNKGRFFDNKERAAVGVLPVYDRGCE
jgi:hypothetical protein